MQLRFVLMNTMLTNAFNVKCSVFDFNFQALTSSFEKRKWVVYDYRGNLHFADEMQLSVDIDRS